jgi:hypothetical protein
MGKNRLKLFQVKTYLGFTLLLLHCTSFNSNEMTEKKLNFRKYLNQSIEFFVNNECDTNNLNYTFTDSRPCRLQGMILQLSDNKKVELVVHNFEFMNPFNENCRWLYDDLKKEKISEIWLYEGNSIIRKWK